MSNDSNSTKLTPSQREILIALSTGKVIRYASYSRPGGVEFALVSVQTSDFKNTTTNITKPTFKRLSELSLIEAGSDNKNDPYGAYYVISAAGLQALEELG